MSFVAELKRRNVFRMAGLYVVGAWLLIQIAETLLPIFHTPDWVLQSMIVLIALGFVPALVFSWLYELTPEGLKRDTEVDPAVSMAPHTAKRLDQLTLVGVLLVLVVVGADRMWPGERTRSGSLPDDPATTDEGTRAEANADPVSPDPTSPAANGDADARSIAVLPFANLSSDPEQEYFSDGMTEELLNVLAKIPGLKVAARTSVFQFKGQGGDVREIGGKLGVSHVIEGSVRRDGQQIRVTAQLIRVADGFHVWSETYDRKLEGIFALQDDLAHRVGEALKASFGMTATAAPRVAIEPQAYDEYLKGRALLRSRRDIPSAIAHFQSAVAQAPTFAAGWSSLSLSYDVGYWYIKDLSAFELADLVVKQADAAERAFALDAESAAAHHALGNVGRKQFRYADAERHLLRAMQIDPGYPDVREDYAELLYSVGRTEESRLAAQQLVQLDPYFGIGWVRVMDTAVHFDRRDEVERAIEQIRTLMPGNSLAKFGLITYAVTWGRTDEARTQLADAARRWPEDARFAQTLIGWALEGQSLDDERLDEALDQATPGDALCYLVARPDLARFNAEVERRGATIQGFYFSYLNDSKRHGHALLREPLARQALQRYGFVDYWREKGWPPVCRPLGDTDFECGIDVATK
ncbi:MAG: hypothetical protein KDJ14_00090 [Xanthomonadales bacterium]|nr:hypothetical protein [Xanthomonadales bacterium]